MTISQGQPIHVLMMEWMYPDDAQMERDRFAAQGITFDIARWQANATRQWPRQDCLRYDAIIHHHGAERLREPVEWFERCRILVRAGVGTDNIDLAAWGRRGVAVTNVPDYGTNEVADHAIALMLGLTRGVPQFDAALREQPVAAWSHDAPPLIRRLAGAVFGVIGMGPIGIAAARRAQGFGMRVVFFDPFLPPGMDLALGFGRVHTLADLMAAADVVSIHAPGTPKTRNMLNAEAFARSRPGQIIVNTARGQIVDLDDLATALRSGRIAGAALDVLPTEPPDLAHPLIMAWQAQEPWVRGRLLITPHAAFYSPASSTDLRQKAVEQVVSYLRTGQLTTCVNRKDLAVSN